MKEIIWTLTPKEENIDYVDLIVKIANKKDINLKQFEVGEVTSIVHSFKDQIFEYLIEHGFSSLVKSELLVEHVIAKGTPTSKIVPIIQLYLDKVGIDNELIIVDPYFYAKPKIQNYSSTITSILQKYISTINEIKIITNSVVDNATKTEIEKEIRSLNTTLNISHKITSDYHDRFWISNSRGKGIVLGTSLNSIGNKYALIDRLNKSDVEDIVNSLNNIGLL